MEGLVCQALYANLIKIIINARRKGVIAMTLAIVFAIW
jgi:hypothetical protein